MVKSEIEWIECLVVMLIEHLNVKMLIEGILLQDLSQFFTNADPSFDGSLFFKHKIEDDIQEHK